MARHVSGLWRAIRVTRRDQAGDASAYDRAFSLLQEYADVSQIHESLLVLNHVDHEEHGRDNFFYGVMELADPVPVDPGPMETFTDKKRHTNRQSMAGLDRLGPAALDAEQYRPKSLKHWLEFVCERHPGRLSLSECIRLGLSLTSALEILHRRGLVHGCIRSSNILYVQGQPKLAELALFSQSVHGVQARSMQDDAYDPPEGPGTIQADLYSLGKVLQEAREEGRGPRDRRPDMLQEGLVPSIDVEARWDEILRRSLGNLPGRFYQHAWQMRDDLERLKIVGIPGA